MKTSYALVRAVRGPVVLILLGVLFALDHSGVIGFDRTFPVLIIAVGLFKLVERLLAPPPPPFPQYPHVPPPPAPPGTGAWSQ